MNNVRTYHAIFILHIFFIVITLSCRWVCGQS